MPILVLSSEPSAGEVFLAAGATHFLSKPFPMATLTQLLRTLLPDETETRALGLRCVDGLSLVLRVIGALLGAMPAPKGKGGSTQRVC